MKAIDKKEREKLNKEEREKSYGILEKHVKDIRVLDVNIAIM